MNNENYNSLIIALAIVIIIIGVTFFIYDYSKEKLDLSPSEYGYIKCVETCDNIANIVGEQQLEVVNCIKECYTFYKNETTENLNE